jgi:hypothetical protein
VVSRVSIEGWPGGGGWGVAGFVQATAMLGEWYYTRSYKIGKNYDSQQRQLWWSRGWGLVYGTESSWFESL